VKRGSLVVVLVLLVLALLGLLLRPGTVPEPGIALVSHDCPLEGFGLTADLRLSGVPLPITDFDGEWAPPSAMCRHMLATDSVAIAEIRRIKGRDVAWGSAYGDHPRIRCANYRLTQPGVLIVQGCGVEGDLLLVTEDGVTSGEDVILEWIADGGMAHPVVDYGAIQAFSQREESTRSAP
jgi:hypothetical protein